MRSKRSPSPLAVRPLLRWPDPVHGSEHEDEIRPAPCPPLPPVATFGPAACASERVHARATTSGVDRAVVLLLEGFSPPMEARRGAGEDGSCVRPARFGRERFVEAAPGRRRLLPAAREEVRRDAESGTLTTQDGMPGKLRAK